MRADSFLDTNVLVYAAASDPSEAGKREAALQLIEREEFALSAQVLQEFYVMVTRKMARPMTALQAMEWLEQLEAFPCMPVDAAMVKIGVEISEQYRISYWDAAIIAAALRAGARTLFSEDLSEGQTYEGVRVVNPFSGQAGQIQDGT